MEEEKENSKEFNFSEIRKSLETARKETDQIRLEKKGLEKRLSDLESKSALQPIVQAEDDDNDDIYVDTKKFKNTIKNLEQKFEKTLKEKELSHQKGKAEEERSKFLDENNDFSQMLQDENVQKFIENNPDLAKSISQMPDDFRRQKLLYHQMKALSKKTNEISDIQKQIDSRKTGEFYQPSGQGSSPFSNQADFSKDGQKKAYEKLQELKKRMSF